MMSNIRRNKIEESGFNSPREMMKRNDLTWKEKSFLGEIYLLDNENGCYANNAYFADFFGIEKTDVSKTISKLKQKGFIEIEIIIGTNGIEKRIIRMTDKLIISNKNEAKNTHSKNGNGGCQNDKGGCQNDNHIKHNTLNTLNTKTNTNTKKENKQKKKVESPVSKLFDYLDERYPENEQVRDKLKIYLKERLKVRRKLTMSAWKVILDDLDKLHDEGNDYLAMIDRAIIGTSTGAVYTKFFPVSKQFSSAPKKKPSWDNIDKERQKEYEKLDHTILYDKVY